MTDNTQPPAILIVDDERTLADLFADFLASKYTVHTAYGGAEALDMIDEAIDVVLLDRRMPDRSGEEVLKAIREAGYDCRVAMVTAITPDVDIVDMGFDDYLSKPVDMTHLNEVVERLLKLNAYDDLVQEYFQLASKKATLESEKPTTELARDEGFTRLQDRLDEIEADLDAGGTARAAADVRSLLGRGGPDRVDG